MPPPLGQRQPEKETQLPVAQKRFEGMDSSTNDKFKTGEPFTPFVPQSGGVTTHETLRPVVQAPSPIDNLATAASDKAKEYKGKAEKVMNDAQDKVRSFQEEGERYVRENPTRAIVSVLGIGLLLGLIFRRR